MKVPKNVTLINRIIYLVVIVIALFRPLEKFPDSLGYIEMAIYRGPVYSLFLQLFSAFSPAIYDFTLILAQVILGILSINVLVTTLKEKLNLAPLFLLAITFLLCVPYIYNQNIANRILSEAVAYPLFLISISFLIQLLTKFESKYLVKSFVFLTLLILTRSQFIHLLPIAIIIVLLSNNIILKRKVLAVAVFLSAPIIVVLADSTYHLTKHGHFVQTPWNGIHLATPLFYVSKNGQAVIFDDVKEKEFFKFIDEQLRSKGLKKSMVVESQSDYYEFYRKNYTEIANHTLFDEGIQFIGTGEKSNELYIELDKLTRNMSVPLIMNNFKDWSILNLKNFINGFGSLKILMIYVILATFGLYGYYIYGKFNLLIMSLLILAAILNCAVISIGMHTLKRFTFYYDWVIFLGIFILMQHFLLHTKER